MVSLQQKSHSFVKHNRADNITFKMIYLNKIDKLTIKLYKLNLKYTNCWESQNMS